MLRGASAEALAGLSEKLGKSGTLAETAKTGEELFGVVRILRSDVALRRVLTDSSVDAEARTGLAETVFGSAVGDRAMKIVSDAAEPALDRERRPARRPRAAGRRQHRPVRRQGRHQGR